MIFDTFSEHQDSKISFSAPFYFWGLTCLAAESVFSCTCRPRLAGNEDRVRLEIDCFFRLIITVVLLDFVCTCTWRKVIWEVIMVGVQGHKMHQVVQPIVQHCRILESHPEVILRAPIVLQHRWHRFSHVLRKGVAVHILWQARVVKVPSADCWKVVRLWGCLWGDCWKARLWGCLCHRLEDTGLRFNHLRSQNVARGDIHCHHPFCRVMIEKMSVRLRNNETEILQALNSFLHLWQLHWNWRCIESNGMRVCRIGVAVAATNKGE